MSDPNEFLRIPQFRGQFTLFSEQLNQPYLSNGSNTDVGTSSPQLQPSINQIFLTNEATDKTEQSGSSFNGISVQLIKNCACCQGNSAIAQCMDCSDYLCQQCVQIHADLDHTKKHHISYLDKVNNKVMASVSDASSGAWHQQSLMDKQQSFDNFNSIGLLETVTKLEQLNFNDQQVLSDTPSNPASSRVVGTGRYSFSSGHSPGNMSSNSTNTSLENLRCSSGGQTPIERTSESESAAGLAYRRPTLPVTCSSDFSTNNFMSSNLYSAPPTCSSIPSTVGLDFGTSSMAYPNFSNTILPIMTAPIDYFPVSLQGVSEDGASALPLIARSNLSMCFTSRWPPCLRHHRPFAFFCTSCMLPACPVCRQLDHSSHNIIEISEAVQNVKLISFEIVGQIRQTILHLRQSLDYLQHTLDEIDTRAHQAVANIKHSFQKCSLTLDSRESRDVLIRIEHARQTKISGITSQMDNIKHYYSKLVQARDSIADHSKFTSPFELMIANYKAFKEMMHAKNFYRCSATLSWPFEDDGYLPNGQLGGGVVNTFEPIHKTYKNSNFFHSKDSTYGNPLQLSMLRCRPVFNCPEMVTVIHFGSIPTKMWSNSGMGQGELCRPWGITCNRYGEVIVADRSNNRIQVFDTVGKFVFEFGTQGGAEGQFHKCAGVAVGPHDEIVVADKDNHRIQVFSRHGEFLFTFGSEGDQLGQFKFPWDVAVDSFGYIIVSDTRNHRVQLFNSNGIFVAKWGGEREPNVPRLFDSPRGVTFDPRGNIMVTDFNLHKVILIERTTGRIRSIGKEGKDMGQFSRPQGLCCDDRGWFVVVDSKNYRYQVFNENGEFLWTVGKQGKSDPGHFDRPSDVCLDQKGHIYIVDSDNHRLQKF
ncbi:E3 ubiquitin-protein ligase TRIM71-like [Sitophilus oryzae]|uniref:E3 ubiquitin-protein ligase TRIM71-like n=1 Tax=Sitophilus oryzae TaxID=7048 RepID=A0A6J2Y244_SITOR|nr:E3 ubiquitin-protein ligase TRIM71-like [Sitophilus oryzae]XP_030757080.1 E3 ubiquitin-protein ligase TRIM71-like [Sitophilus oryzae]